MSICGRGTRIMTLGAGAGRRSIRCGQLIKCVRKVKAGNGLDLELRLRRTTFTCDDATAARRAADQAPPPHRVGPRRDRHSPAWQTGRTRSAGRRAAAALKTAKIEEDSHQTHVPPPTPHHQRPPNPFYSFSVLSSSFFSLFTAALLLVLVPLVLLLVPLPFLQNTLRFSSSY